MKVMMKMMKKKRKKREESLKNPKKINEKELNPINHPTYYPWNERRHYFIEIKKNEKIFCVLSCEFISRFFKMKNMNIDELKEK